MYRLALSGVTFRESNTDEGATQRVDSALGGSGGWRSCVSHFSLSTTSQRNLQKLP